MVNNSETKPSGFFEALFAALGSIFDDVRGKVVEEGWFGRQVSEAADISPIKAPDITPPNEPAGAVWEPPKRSIDELWAPAERSPDKTTTDHDHGMDL